MKANDTMPGPRNGAGHAARELFDPTSDLFVAQFDRPARLEPVNFRALAPFERALMVIDGTVTKFIEAYMMEPVEVRPLSQTRRTLPAAEKWLEAPEGMPVLARQVKLVGGATRALYAYAGSLIALERLPERLQGELAAGGGGIGRILLQGGIENRREVLWYGREHLTGLPETSAERPGSGWFLSRTYRVIMNGRPVMLINERFPFRAAPAAAHH